MKIVDGLVRHLVVVPDGALVWPDAEYDDVADAGLFGLAVKGTDQRGEPTTVRGTHIARVVWSELRPQWYVHGVAETGWDRYKRSQKAYEVGHGIGVLS